MQLQLVNDDGFDPHQILESQTFAGMSSGCEERTIELTDLVVEVLTAWRQEQRKETLGIGLKPHETTQRHYFKDTPNARVKGFANQIKKAT